MTGATLAAVGFWVVLTVVAVLLVLFLLWRYQLATARARRRRGGREPVSLLRDHPAVTRRRRRGNR